MILRWLSKYLHNAGNISVQCCLGFCNNCMHSAVLVSVNEDQKWKCSENEEHGNIISLSDLKLCLVSGKVRVKIRLIFFWLRPCRVFTFSHEWARSFHCIYSICNTKLKTWEQLMGTSTQVGHCRRSWADMQVVKVWDKCKIDVKQLWTETLAYLVVVTSGIEFALSQPL